MINRILCGGSDCSATQSLPELQRLKKEFHPISDTCDSSANVNAIPVPPAHGGFESHFFAAYLPTNIDRARLTIA
jgi:hypothetical protein